MQEMRSLETGPEYRGAALLTENITRLRADVREYAADNGRIFKSKLWVKNGGNPWVHEVWHPGMHEPNFVERWRFVPEAYDPAKPHEPEGKIWIPARNPEKILEDPFDLDNLRIIDRKEAKQLHLNLEKLAFDCPNDKYVTAVIAMGGTIAMGRTKDGTIAPMLNADQLLAKVPDVNNMFLVDTLNFKPAIDSSQNEIDYNAEAVIVMSYIWKNASPKLKEKLAGFVIPHGTDTLGDSAAYTAAMTGPNIPFSVIKVGAQKTSEDAPNDVQANLNNAFIFLRSLKENNINLVGVCAGGTSGGLYDASAVMKVSDSSVLAFASPTRPKIFDAATFQKNPTYSFWGQYHDQAKFQQELASATPEYKPVIMRGYAPVIETRTMMGQDPEFVYNSIMANRHKAVAVILTTFGSFTANEKGSSAVMVASSSSLQELEEARRGDINTESRQQAAVMAARESGLLVFATNPFPEGSTDHEYATTKELRDKGVIALRIPPNSATVKITLAHHLLGRDLEAIEDFVVKTNHVGEYNPDALEAMINYSRGQGSQFRFGMPADLVHPIATGRIRDPLYRRPSG